MDSSIRSRQTGQVGSSINEGVGGANGLIVREDAAALAGTGLSVADVDGVNGSLAISGKEEVCAPCFGVRISTDLMKTT